MAVGYGAAVAGWLYIYLAVQARRRHGEALVAVREAQLQALTAQLNPHFLFNCLNSIRALIVERPADAAAMVTGLADLLRYSLSADRRRTVTLAEELAIVDEYVNLERMRFEDRLRTDRTVDPAALTARVPPMLVQTLIENAVKHGIASSTTGGTVHLRVKIENRTLEIEVTNTGAFKTPVNAEGRGLRNAADRLRLIYGAAASLTVRGTSEHAIASLSIPLEAAP
jgi:LytS/YehU family sensor histidine kinase